MLTTDKTRKILAMARLDIEIPKKWKLKLQEIGEKRGGASIRQLVRDAIYNEYIKSQDQRAS